MRALTNCLKIAYVCTIVFANIAFTIDASGQATVFTALKDPAQRAEQLFSEKQFKPALELFLSLSEKSRKYDNRIAACYFQLGSYQKSAEWYKRGRTASNGSPADFLQYAEALAFIGDYGEAMKFYKKYNEHRADANVARKVWQLSNVEFLYEDSLFYSVEEFSGNSPYHDMAAVHHGSQLIFLSNRTGKQVVRRTDASTGGSFYKWYSANAKPDSLTGKTKVSVFAPELFSPYHQGPLHFYNNGTSVVYATTAEIANGKGVRQLVVRFASLQKNEWKHTSDFTHNNTRYSVTDPWVNETGDTLYFSSDMPGGFGGKDLYRSFLINGKWTTPQNLGETINTSMDERYPFILRNILYFSSSGQPGLGGLDIYRVTFSGDGFGEVKNLGYPANTNFDDFALTLNQDGSKGYFTSNRKGEKTGDNIFEIAIDLQEYPLIIHGTLAYKDIRWNDSTDVRPLPDVHLQLIDNLRNTVVYETASDQNSQFTLSIPYFSQYRIRVIEPGYRESTVSLDLSRRKVADTRFEIVVVRDIDGDAP